MEELHKSVLLSEVLGVLRPQPGETYLDLTAGYAGHASEILDATRTHKNTDGELKYEVREADEVESDSYRGSTLVDRDKNAVRVLCEKFEKTGVKIVQMDFYEAVLREIECGNAYDMILADLGVSSPQLDEPERGFSFRQSGPLDMRMDVRQDLTAERIVNKWSERELAEIFVKYGEVNAHAATKVARLIVTGRPWSDTMELAETIAAGRSGKRHPATRIFQAIRIAVNDELGLLKRTLPLLPKLLKSGGRVAIITFHSLEDRIVKEYLREVASYGEESELEVLTRKPIVAGEMELFINPRARSAKLRAARKR